MITLEEIRFWVAVGVSVCSFGISLGSFVFARRSWHQANRPIVTAFVDEKVSDVGVGIFDLVVSNTGNRPATSVRLWAKTKDVDSLFHENAPEESKESTRLCFADSADIPLLRNGEEVPTAFGVFSDGNLNKEWLVYDKEIPIEVRYADLEGRKYCSKMPLRIYAREGFGGGVWEESGFKSARGGVAASPKPRRRS